MTCHVKHIFMPIDQTNAKLFISFNNLLNQTISIPFILQPKENSLILEQFNPILCRPSVHHGTFLKVLIDNFCRSKPEKSSSFHTII